MSGKAIGLFKRLSMNHFHIPVATAHMVVGLIIGGYYVTYVHDGEAVGYMPGYVVMRPDDPRVPKLKKFPYDP